jgi:hypothetical protein
MFIYFSLIFGRNFVKVLSNYGLESTMLTFFALAFYLVFMAHLEN